MAENNNEEQKIETARPRAEVRTAPLPTRADLADRAYKLYLDHTAKGEEVPADELENLRTAVSKLPDFAQFRSNFSTEILSGQRKPERGFKIMEMLFGDGSADLPRDILKLSDYAGMKLDPRRGATFSYWAFMVHRQFVEKTDSLPQDATPEEAADLEAFRIADKRVLQYLLDLREQRQTREPAEVIDKKTGKKKIVKKIVLVPDQNVIRIHRELEEFEVKRRARKARTFEDLILKPKTEAKRNEEIARITTEMRLLLAQGKSMTLTEAEPVIQKILFLKDWLEKLRTEKTEPEADPTEQLKQLEAVLAQKKISPAEFGAKAEALKQHIGREKLMARARIRLQNAKLARDMAQKLGPDDEEYEGWLNRATEEDRMAEQYMKE